MKKHSPTVIEQWLLNNRLSVVLLNLLLLFLVIYVFNKISYVLNPAWAFLNAVFPPLLVAGLQYYMMNPLVDWLEKCFRVPRTLTIVVLFLLVVLLIVWLLNWLLPIIQSQAQSLIDNWPRYWRDTQNTVTHALRDPRLHYFRKDINRSFNNLTSAFGDDPVGLAWSNINSAVSVVTMIVMTLLTAPFVLFFMLKDGKELKPFLVKVMPKRLRGSFGDLLTDINRAVADYVRGQLTVAFWVGVMFGIGYTIVGQSYAALLAVLAGVFNLVPYFGTFIALIPSLVLAIMNSPMMLVKVLIVFAVEQTIESRVVSPLVMGNRMKMHPVTTILLLIGASALGGLWGVIFAIPLYAILKIILLRLFNYYRRISTFYNEPDQNTQQEGSKQ